MQLPELYPATLVRRYKRFLADMVTDDGTLTAHCPNTGAMTGCAEPGSSVWFSLSDNEKRKYPATFELIETVHGLCSVNTGRANHLVGEAIRKGWIADLGDAETLRAEAAIPGGGGRFDFALDQQDDSGKSTFIEVKSVTLLDADGLGLFPDAVSARALKHVEALMAQVSQGHRGVLVFCAQHTGVQSVAPAALIHPEYAQGLVDAVAAGVEVRAYSTEIDLAERSMRIAQPLPVLLEPLS